MKKEKTNQRSIHSILASEREPIGAQTHHQTRYIVRTSGPVQRHDPFGIIGSDRYLDEQTGNGGW